MRERRKTYTFNLLNTQGPLAIPVGISFGDDSDIDLETWQGGGSNTTVGQTLSPCWLLKDRIDPTEAANRVNSATPDVICAVPRAGVARVSLDEEVRNLTVFFETVNNSGMSQSVSVTVIECVRDRVSLVDSR